ncbi:MAG: hypothetical protein WAT66_08565, partial [Actinomycetota bacterium]
PALVGGLAVALAVSLAVNAIVALRLKDESDQQAKLRVQVANLQAELDALRKQSPQGGVSLLARIASAMEELRHLTFTKVVKPELLTDEQLAARVEEQFKKDSPRAELEKDDAVLTALGLLGPRDDLFDILLGVQREQVAGFYDTKKKVLVVGGDVKNPTPLDQVLLAHEYVHALTDQHFDLTRYDTMTDEGKDDEATAYLSLLEGDATVMMFEYAREYLTPSQQQDVQNEAAGVPSNKLLAAPNVIRQSLLFPYEKGQEFVGAIIGSGGTAALDKAYKDPPTSTEQILHPSKYLSRRDDPTPLDMPDLARAMGSGWTALPGGGIGEFDIQLLIDQFLSSGDARDAAAGWDGGRYVAADSSKGTAVAIETVWDSPTEAREASSVLERWLPGRYANEGADVRIQGATGRGWDSPDGAGAVTRNGTRVLIVVGPDRASVDRARSAFPGF